MEYDKSGRKGNDSHMGMLKGKSGSGVMPQGSGVSSIETTMPQKYDMGRCKYKSMNNQGYSQKAFDYKY